jgi:hypothetical protein
VKGFLKFCQVATLACTLDSLDTTVRGSHREYQAAPHHFAIESHSASATYPLFASNASPANLQLIAQKVDQMHAWFD